MSNTNTSHGGSYGNKPSKDKKDKKKENQAEALIDVPEPPMPKVVIISDGDVASTKVFIRGQEISVDELCLDARKGDPNSEWEYDQKDRFNLCMTMNHDVDGMQQSVTMRMREKAALEAISELSEHTPSSVRAALRQLIDKELKNDD